MAVTKILDLEQQVVLDAYSEEIDRIKREAEAEKKVVQYRVMSSAKNLAAVSEETNAAYRNLIIQADEIKRFVVEATQLSTLTEETASKGRVYIVDQTEIMDKIRASVTDISNDTQVLISFLEEMKEIVEIVTDIANQTNLLSLNAAIEAARANNSRKGFAVVASEIRLLAEKTKVSAKNVAKLISNTNGQVNNLESTLSRIIKAVETGNINMNETGKQFEEILHAMGQTLSQNHHIQRELVYVVRTVNELGEAFDEITNLADNLTTITEMLQDDK